MSTIDVPTQLEKAADLLEGGWIQGENSRPQGYCLAAAINRVTPPLTSSTSIDADTHRFLGDSSPDILLPFAKWLLANRTEQVKVAVKGPFVSDATLARWMRGEVEGAEGISLVQKWNDYGYGNPINPELPARTRAEVLAALREAAAELRGVASAGETSVEPPTAE